MSTEKKKKRKPFTTQREEAEQKVARETFPGIQAGCRKVTGNWIKTESVCSRSPPSAGKEHAWGLHRGESRGGSSQFAPSRAVSSHRAWILDEEIKPQTHSDRAATGSRQSGLSSLLAVLRRKTSPGAAGRSRPALRETR